MEKLKICFVISGMAYSGAEIVLERYLMDNKYIEPYFIVIFNNSNIINKLESIYGYEKVFSTNLNYYKNILRINPWYYQERVLCSIQEIIDKIKPQLIYSNNTTETYLMSKVIKKYGIKSIAHIHDMKSSKRNPILKKATIDSFGLYNKVLFVSKANKESWNVENSEFVYNGLDEKYFKCDSKKYKSIKKIGFVGSICKRKGIDLLINNIEDLIQLDLQVYIAYGMIEDTKIYKQLLELKNKYNDHICIYENLDSEQIKDLYDKLDVLIVPSRQDPLPTVIMECMARRTIVIGRNIDGIPEMINNDELLFENSNEMVKVIQRLVNSNEKYLNKLSSNQYEYCRSKFTDELKTNQLNSIILSVMNKDDNM